MVARFVSLLLGPLLLVLLTAAADPRWALLQFIAIYVWLVPALTARWWQARLPPSVRDRPAQWCLTHRRLLFAFYVYLFATLLFGIPAFVASGFVAMSPATFGWLVAVTTVIAIVITSLVWRSQIAFWESRVKQGPAT